MRIQHNIPAMNAYRNYNTNVKSLQGNLQKLSSGYKINKAGDDAAGLAISEKMRAQITGLEVAQKNAKDGISLVQTAEGAMTEIHTMLNRMFSLAEQSANGTYQNEVDREQLNNEFQKLTQEIDRIAEATNFNGRKILDGSMYDASMDTSAVSSSAAGAKAIEEVGAALDATNAAKFAGVSLAFDAAATDDQKAALNKALEKASIEINVHTTGGNYSNADYVEFKGLSDLGYDVKVKDGSGADSLIREKKAAANNMTDANKIDTNANMELSFYDKESGAKVGTLTLTKPASAVTNTGDNKSTITFTAPVYGTNGTLGDENATNLGKFGITEIDFGDVELKGGTEVKAEYTTAKKLTITVGTQAFEYTADDTALALAGSTIDAKDTDGNTIKVTLDSTTGNVKIGSDQTTAINNGGGGTPWSLGKVNLDSDGKKGGVGEEGALRLRIGDSTESYDDIYVNVKSMRASALADITNNTGKVLSDLKIDDPNNADEAMNALKGMINYVSNERGNLGATQNRLDHTINNLSTMQENIQDAEATIRDVDVANEMMAYTKNNILVQSAQAMLAQANQLPQGVLQLLG